MFGDNMTIFNPFIWANRNGIVRLESTGVDINTNNVVFNFNNHRFLNANYSGLIIFKLPAYTAPTTAVPVVFNTNGRQQNVTKVGNTNVTSAELNEAGIYLAYYENGVLQLLTGI